MATPSTKTTSDLKTEPTSKPAAEMPVFADTLREQLISTVKQGQQLSLDAAQTWVKTISVLPMADMPSIPGIPALPGVEAATKYAFDLTADLLSAQREYVLQLASAFVPAKPI